MKIIVIGAGAAGLTAAATLAKADHEVIVVDHNQVSGGVLQGWQKEGFTWDLGQLLIEGLGSDEPLGEVMLDLGIFNQVKTIIDERRYVFPDFDLQKPETYQGAKWRIERLKQEFPNDAAGLDRYWNDYLRFVHLMTVARQSKKQDYSNSISDKIRLIWAVLPFFTRRDWTAEKLMASYFSSEKLRAVFISILADFFTPPSQFQGLGVFALNPETSFDKRIPKQLKKDIVQLNFYSFLGGTRPLVDALETVILAHNGQIRLGQDVTRVMVTDGKVSGVEINHGEILEADLVLASGGADELFFDLIGKEQLSAETIQMVNELPLMDSVFMVHLGLDTDPKPYIGGSCTYYYRTYDIEGSIQQGKQGYYHEGEQGFVVHVPTNHSPEMAPDGYHAMTVYTICPDTLSNGTWQDQKDQFADKLIQLTEEHFPGLSKHIVNREIFTAEEFRELTHTKHHSFGGLAPIMRKNGIPHQTPIEGLWFIGHQSESGGGLMNVIPAAHRVAKKLIN